MCTHEDIWELLERYSDNGDAVGAYDLGLMGVRLDWSDYNAIGMLARQQREGLS